MKGDYEALVCGKSQLHWGQGLTAATGFLPISRMFLKLYLTLFAGALLGSTGLHRTPGREGNEAQRRLLSGAKLASGGRTKMDFSKMF